MLSEAPIHVQKWKQSGEKIQTRGPGESQPSSRIQAIQKWNFSAGRCRRGPAVMGSQKGTCFTVSELFRHVDLRVRRLRPVLSRARSPVSTGLLTSAAIHHRGQTGDDSMRMAKYRRWSSPWSTVTSCWTLDGQPIPYINEYATHN